MRNTQLFKEEYEVSSRLSEFGVSKAEFIQIVHEVVSARNDSVAIDPINAKGLLAYIFGVRGLRKTLLPKNWTMDRTYNIEGTVNPEGTIKIVYQNCEDAANPNPMKHPKVLSSKGPAIQKMVGDQPYLFPDMEEENLREIEEHNRNLKCKVWFLCISVNEDDVRAELSCPVSIEDGQFNGFSERIFLLQKGDWDGGPDFDDFDPHYEDEVDEFEVEISRK